MTSPLAKRPRGPFLLGPRVNRQSCRGKDVSKVVFCRGFRVWHRRCLTLQLDGRCGLAYCCKKALQRGPSGQGRIPYSAPHRSHGNQAKEYALPRRRPFCLLLLPGKSTSAGGPRPAGSVLALTNDKDQQIDNLLIFCRTFNPES